jgi:hypothetical protein
LYSKNPEDLKINPDPGSAIYETARERYGEEMVRRDANTPKGGNFDFPVLNNDGRISSSYDKSETLRRLPVATFDHVFLLNDLIEEGKDWLKKNRFQILHDVSGEE